MTTQSLLDGLDRNTDKKVNYTRTFLFWIILAIYCISQYIYIYEINFTLSPFNFGNDENSSVAENSGNMNGVVSNTVHQASSTIDYVQTSISEASSTIDYVSAVSSTIDYASAVSSTIDYVPTSVTEATSTIGYKSTPVPEASIAAGYASAPVSNNSNTIDDKSTAISNTSTIDDKSIPMSNTSTIDDKSIPISNTSNTIDDKSIPMSNTSIIDDKSIPISNTSNSIDATLQSIPHKIFQTCWTKNFSSISDKKKSTLYKYAQSTWINLNPGFSYELFDDDDILKFMSTYFPWFYENLFKKYDFPLFEGKSNILKADAIRVFYLYKYGGIYADTDFECLKGFNNLFQQFDKADIILGRMKTYDNWWVEKNSIPNALMISKPRQEFWLVVMKLLLERQQNHIGLSNVRVEELTGPMVIYDAMLIYNQWKSNIKNEAWYKQMVLQLGEETPVLTPTQVEVLDPKLLYPYSWALEDFEYNYSMGLGFDEMLINRTEFVRMTRPESFAITYWTHSWEN